MLVALGQPPHFTLGKPLLGNWPTTMPVIPTPMNPTENIEKKRLPWDNFPPMPSVCTICTGTYGNGVPILGTIIMMVRRGMEVSGQKMRMIIVLLCGAVLGTSVRMSAVPLSASTSIGAPSSTTSAVFAWCAVPGGLCNPFSLFSLFTLILYFFSFPSLSRPFFGVLGRFWGYLGARDAPLRVLGLFGRTRCAPTGFGVIWAHQKAKTPASS